jgi:hypothetical protein
MLVRDAITLLKLMPQDAVLVGTDGPVTPKAPKGELREGPKEVHPVLNGFSAYDLKREEWDLFLLKDSNIVILAMTRNSRGQEI